MGSCDRQSGSSGTDQPWSRPSSTARVIAAVPNRARTSSTAASSAPSRGAVERQRRAASAVVVVEVGDREADQREAAAIDHRDGDRQQLPGGRRGSSWVSAVAYGSVCDRVAREKSSKRRRRTTVRPTRPAARIRRVTRSTSEIRIASIASGDRGARPSARCDPIERRRRRACTGRGSRLWASACRCRPEAAAEQSTPARPRPAAATSPTVDDPALVQLARRSPARPPTAARPAAGAGTRARRRAAPPAGRRAWPPRSPPWPGTWCARCRP